MCCIFTFVGHARRYVRCRVVGYLADWKQHWLRWENIPSICVDVKKNGVHARPWWSGIYSGINKRCIRAQLPPTPPRLQMLLNNMSWEKCIRQRRGVTAIFRRHFPPGAPLGKEKKRRKKRAGRSYRRRERNHLLHKTSETSRTCSAAKRPAAIAELNWYWCALSSAQTWHVLSKYNVDEWAPGWVHVCYLPAVWRHVQQVFFGQNE